MVGAGKSKFSRPCSNPSRVAPLSVPSEAGVATQGLVGALSKDSDGLGCKSSSCQHGLCSQGYNLLVGWAGLVSGGEAVT